MWRDPQEHGAGVRGQGLLDFLQERLTVEAAGAVGDGRHARLALHTLGRGTTGGLADASHPTTFTNPYILRSIQPMSKSVLRHLAKLADRKTADKLQVEPGNLLSGTGKTL